jgi:phosphate/phosphite/phosphonate ABC transporter binding protein
MPHITLAVVPSATPGDAHALERLCGVLGEMLDTSVRGVQPESYSALTTELEMDRVQYAWMSPALVVLASEKLRITPLLSAVREDRTDYASALFVPASSAIQGIQDLRGARVAWVDRTSASGYLMPRLQLAARGLDPAELFCEELFLRSHSEVVRAVLDGRADVGATYGQRPAQGEAVRRAGFLDVAPDQPMRVLDWSAAIPNDVIAGHGLLARQAHRTFANAILALVERPEGRKLLFDAFHTERFTATPRDALRPLWPMVKLARTHGLLHLL